MYFFNLTQKHIELNLDDIFDENGYKNKYDEKIYQQNNIVETIKLTRTKDSPIKIGDNFLYFFSKLTNINFSGLTNVTQIGNFFLSYCFKLSNIDLSLLSNIKQIGDGFLCDCSELRNIVLSPLSNVTRIGNYFLCDCLELVNIDLSPLSNVAQIGDYFLYGCSGLNYIIINYNNIHIIENIEKIKQYNPNIEIKMINTLKFKNFNDDMEIILKNKIFVKELMNYLEIKFHKKNSHKVLLKKIYKIKEEYTVKPSENYLKFCLNTECIFTLDELKEIPIKKLIQLSRYKDKYYCFDVLYLKEYIFKKESDKYINPYTKIKFTEEDIDKILKVDLKKIKYFCSLV
jgi:hypothetical protein